jgi:HPt (histidine-containing phosphotransfer) domain-containing protein
VSERERPLRSLLVGGADGAWLRAAVSSDMEVEQAATMVEAVLRLDSPPPVDIVLLDTELPDGTVLEAFALLHERAPDVPVVVVTRTEGDHLALAIGAATRSPRTAAAGARRVASLLPSYLAHRERDVVTLREALDRGDYEVVARIGHNLRGNGVSFGFPELRALGERIEAAAHPQSPSDVQEPIAELRAYLDGILGRGQTPRRPASSTRVRTMTPDDARLAGKK